MALASLLNTSVEVQRKSATRDSSGGQVEGYHVVNSLLNIPALIQPAKSRAQRVLAQRQVFITHHIYLAAEYDIRRGDRIYEPATGRYFTSLGLFDMAGMQRAWRIDCVEET